MSKNFDHDAGDGAVQVVILFGSVLHIYCYVQEPNKMKGDRGLRPA